MGCHSGLSVSDVLVGSTDQDWAQTLGRENSLFIGNTGFGYGDTEVVAYTEQLMALFAGYVTAPLDLATGAADQSSTIGQALAWAKNDYVSGLQTFSVYDEKAVMESTFYGLPFYRVGLETDDLPAPPTRQTTPDARTGTASSTVDVDATNTPVSTSSGTYYANPAAGGGEDLIVAPGQPIQPKVTTDISVVSPTDPTKLSQVAHGAIVLGLDSTYVAAPNPVVATPIFDESSSQPEPAVADAAFPAKPLTITSSTGPGGERQQLLVATGKYRADTQTQRLDDNLDVVVYYADLTETDFTPPTIGKVQAINEGGLLSVGVDVADDNPVDRVYVLVAQNPGTAGSTWTGLDLVPTGGGRWAGSLRLEASTTAVEFLVQAKDAAGNVGIASNKADNFDTSAPAPSVLTPPPATLTVQQPAPLPSGVYDDPAIFTVTELTGTATLVVDGASRGPVTRDGSFTISGAGPHTWSIATGTGYVASGSLVIDPPPVVTGTADRDANAADWWNQPFSIDWSVDDPSANRPPSTPVTTEGAGQVFASDESCDLAGSCATGTFTADVDFQAPTITASASPAPTAAGWNNTDVVVTSVCVDSLSGVASCPEPITVTNAGANQFVTVSAVDRAGNVGSTTSLEIRIDRTPPVVTLNAPANGATIPENSYATPTCTVTDAPSGSDGVCSIAGLSEPDMSTPGRAVYNLSATGNDRAGNSTTVTRTFTVLTDLAGPIVDAAPTPPPNGAGWWRTAVTFRFTCNDPTGVQTCPADRTVSGQGANQGFAVTATDRNGNVTELNVSSINIDLTLPTVTVTGPSSVGPLDTVTLTCAASDALSGIATSTCANRTFSASELVPGSNVFTFSATDVAGNVRTVTKTVTLVIPVNPAPVVRADMGVAGLNEIGFRSNVVILVGEYSDPSGPGPYRATVRWSAGGTFGPLALAGDGSFAAATIYPSAGTRTVTVKICDAGGACGTDDVTVRTSVGQKISPVAECVVDRGAGANPRYQAKWGYDNPAPFAIAVAATPVIENTFTAAPFLRGQPQVLRPGSQRNVFTTTFNSGNHTWRINGKTATANSSSPRC